MHDDLLKPLFDEVDIAPSMLGISPLEMSSRVCSVHRRRQRRRRVIATAGLVVLGVLLWRGIRRLDEAPSPRSATDEPQVVETRAIPLPLELAQLRERIDREQQIVTSLIASEHRQRARALVKELNVGLDSTGRSDEQMGRASMAILLSADRVAGRESL
jgi:hypothetical protein